MRYVSFVRQILLARALLARALLACALPACVLLVPAAARGQGAPEHIALGDRASAALNPAAALEHYEAALRTDSTNGEVLGKASRSAVDIGEQVGDASQRTALFRKGEQYARRAVAASPNDAEAHFHLARALGRTALTLGVRDRVRYARDVRAEALAALALDPNHPGALHVLGAWNAEVMRLSGIERFLARRVLGGQVFSQASWKDAVSNLERAVEVDPQRLTHRLDLGKIYLDIGEKAKAREQFEFVVRGRTADYNDPVYKREAEAALRQLD